MGADSIIGGHGDVMHGAQEFELWKEYFQELMDRTASAYAQGASLDDARKTVSDALVKKYADSFGPTFSGGVVRTSPRLIR